MSNRTSKSTLLAASMLLTSGCLTANFGDSCSGSAPAGIDSDALGVILGAPTDRIGDSPYIKFYTPSAENPDLVLELNLTPAQLSWPDGLDESGCKKLDWRTYRVKTDPEQWEKFWGLPRPLPVAIMIGPVDSEAPLYKSRLAFAFVDTSTDKVVMSCGCYWTRHLTKRSSGP